MGFLCRLEFLCKAVVGNENRDSDPNLDSKPVFFGVEKGFLCKWPATALI